MGSLCSKVQEKNDESSRRLSITAQPHPVSDLPPHVVKEGTIPNSVVKMQFAAVSVAGTYFQPTKNPFRGTVKYKTNQDNFFVTETLIPETQTSFVGVMDGHGVVGHDVSQFLTVQLPLALQKEDLSGAEKIEASLRNIYLNINSQLGDKSSNIDTFLSGSTCVTCYINGTEIYCANSGDSRCVIGYLEDDEFRAKDLSNDHKPDLEEEKKRIHGKGGRVAPLSSWPEGPHRVWLKSDDIPGLAMSRSFGDRLAHSVGVIVDPEIITHTLRPRVDKFMILASDGVWEFISSEKAVEIVSACPDPRSAAELLCKEAIERWQKEEPVCDDVTSLIIFFQSD